MTTLKFALGSTVKDGLFCVDGHERKVSTEFQEGERYEGLVKLFDTRDEANRYIEENELWALEPVEFNHV